MSNRNSLIKIIVQVIILLTMIASCLAIVLTPYTTRSWSVGSDSYEYDAYFYGYWNLYNNTEFVSSGGSSTLDNFLVISPVLIITGLVLSVILVPVLGAVLGFEEKFQGNAKRILSILVVLIGIIGFVGVMLFLPYFNYLDNLHNETQLGVGFILSIILFVVVTLYGLALAIFPSRNARHNLSYPRSLE